MPPDPQPAGHRLAASANGDLPPPSAFALHWREIFLLFLGSRLFVFLIAGLSLRVVNKGPQFTPPASPLDWFMHWDAPWYLDLARHGYYFTRDGDPTNVVFLPLYPALVRLASLGGLIPLPVAGYTVSLGCLWLACVWLWRAVAREWDDPKLATTTVAFLLFGPVSFFFSSIYSEALFLPLVVGCLMFAREGRWALAGSLGALAAATRFVGVVLIVPLLWEYVTVQARSGGATSRFRVAPLVACALPFAGLGAYCLVMWLQLGDPLIYFRGQLHWGRHFTWWWGLFARDSFTGQTAFYQMWFAATVVCAFGLLALGAWLRVPATWLIFGLSFAFVYISSRFVEGLPRYFSVVFPLYISLALFVRRHPGAGRPLFASSAALQTLSIALFVNGYWFT